MLMQLPVPPDVVVVGGGPPEEVILMVTLAVLTVGFFLLRPLFRAWGKRIEHGAGNPELAADVEQMRERLQDVDMLHQRIGELEERVDFTERLLAEGKRQEIGGSRE